MKSLRIASLLALLVLFGMVAPVSAAEPAVAAGPQAVGAPEVGLFPLFTPAPVPAANRCPTSLCPAFPPDDCTCQWIECPDGRIVCGRWSGVSLMTPASAAPTALFRF